MAFPRFTSELDRLFDRLVREAWQGSPRTGAPQPWTVEVPLPKGNWNLAVEVRDHVLEVVFHRRRRSTRAGRNTAVSRSEREEIRHTFTLPAGTDTSCATVRVEDGRVVIRLGAR